MPDLEIFEDMVSMIKPYDENMFKGYIPKDENTFLLIIEDEHCEKSKKAIKEFEAIILQKLETREKEMKEMKNALDF